MIRMQHVSSMCLLKCSPDRVDVLTQLLSSVELSYCVIDVEM